MLHATNSALRVAFAALVTVLLLSPPVGADPPPKDAEALGRSLDMLHLQMKMKVLEVYSERAGFYIPPQWTKAIQDEHQKLAEQVSGAAAMQNVDPDKWLAESRKARENEVLATYKLLQDNMPKLLKGDKWLQEYKQFQQQQELWQRNHNQNLVEVSRFVEDLIRPVELENKEKVEILWRRSARAVFRGAVKDTDDLVSAVTAYDKQRMDVEARLVLLKEYEQGLDIAKLAYDPINTAADKAQEQALARLQTWLKENYTDIDEDKVKMYWKWGKDGFVKMKELYVKYGELDQNVVLKGNPNAMAIAKRFAVLGAAYKYTLGLVKDTAPMKAFGPLVDFLDYYGDAINLLPDIAIKTQTMVNKTDQDFKNVRAVDAWRATEKPPGDLRQLTAFDGFGLQVATDATIDDMTGPNARFYLVVDKSVVPRGYAMFNAEQFARLSQALADERFVNAPGEAWRWQHDWVLENMFEWRNTNPLSPVASNAYLDDLTKKSRKTPLAEKDLIALANNQPVTIGGKQWTCESLRKEAELKLDTRAEELAVRSAISSGYKQQDLAEWTAYKIILRRRAVAFTPQQILRLFNYYHQSGPNANQLLVYLAAAGDERSARARGTVRLGIPLVTSDSREEAIPAGSTVKLTAHVIVSDLAPGRSVEGQVLWTMPKWATAPSPAPITLTNGFQQVSCDLPIPKNVRGDDIQVKVTIKVPVEKGEDAVFDATNSLKVKPSRSMAPPLPSLMAAFIGAVEADSPAEAPKPAFREFTGTGLLEIGPAGPLQISIRRFKPYGITAIDVISESLSDLKPDEPKQGLKFILYRAQSPEGPWVNPITNFVNGNAAFVAFPNSKPLTDLKQPSSGLVDKNTLRILEIGQNDPKAPHRPFYYRVGQVGFVVEQTSGRDVGKEVFSNVVAPDRSAIILFWSLTEKPDEPWVGHTVTWASANVSLSLPNQAFDVRGAHLLVDVGGWPSHYWSHPTVNGAVQVGGPNKFDGLTITVSGSGEGYSATGSVTVPPGDAKYAQDARKRADEALKRADAAIKYNTDEAEKAKKREAELVAEIAKITDTSKYEQADQLYRCEETLATVRVNIRYYGELEGPAQSIHARIEAAYNLQDWAQVLALRRQEMDLAKLRMDLMLEALNGREAALTKLLGRGDVPKDRRDNWEAGLKNNPREREGLKAKYKEEMTGGWAGVAEAAWLAGDAATFLDARIEEVRLFQERGEKASVPSILGDTAEKYARLSGDRDGAARLYVMAHAAHMANAPPERRAELEKYWQESSVPPWLHPDFQRKPTAAALPNDADFNAVQESAKKAMEKKPPATGPAPPS